ncbi:MAG: hypothetical protein ACJ74O_11275 [Frankiaceae bacterium]
MGLPDSRPRILGRIGRQAEDYLLQCEDAHLESIFACLDAIAAGEFDKLPITQSYLDPDAFSVLTTTGCFVIFDVQDDTEHGDIYNVLLAGELFPPTDIVDR